MRFYIDYENVGCAGLNGVEQLSDTDTVRIYYSNNPGVTMDNVRLLVQSKAKIQFLRLPDSIKKMNMSNALDIVIMSDISRLLENHDLSQCMYIITNDGGYDSVISDLNTKFGNMCFRYETIGNSLRKEAPAVIPAAVTASDDIRSLFDNELKPYKSEKANILNIVSSSRTRTEINNKLHQKYGQELANTAIKALKPYIKSLPGQ